MVEVLDRRVPSVEAGLVAHHAEPWPDGIQALWNAQSVELDDPGVWMKNPAEAAERGGFTGAVLAKEHEDLALLHLEVDAPHGVDVAEALVQTLDPDHR